jgi:hypothetical protein
METGLKKTIWSVICFIFFLTLAGGSGCDGCQNSGTYYNESTDSDSIPETPVYEEVEKEGTYSYDIEEDEREEEETFKSESEDDQEVEFNSETETESGQEESSTDSI